MSKRPLYILPVAACVGFLIYLIPKGGEPAGVAKLPEAATDGKAAEPVDCYRLVGERPGKESLASLRVRLRELGAAAAVAEIEGFLASGEDSSTGLGFQVGSGGTMEGWPTLRVFLLDFLLEIDPAAAARISRDILRKPTTADEWALALRNVARGEADAPDPDFLREKTEELIANDGWRKAPSVGFLNAFDVLVHTRATASAPLLSGLIQDKDRRDLAHAAFLTLDRLVQREPVAMLGEIGADRALQESRPEMAAQQFARADLRDETQRAIVKAWLLDPARTPTELRNFSGVFPNNNRMISNNLLTTEVNVSGDDLRAHDREVLAIVRRWREDAAFALVAEHLAEMEARLSEFVKGADE